MAEFGNERNPPSGDDAADVYNSLPPMTASESLLPSSPANGAETTVNKMTSFAMAFTVDLKKHHSRNDDFQQPDGAKKKLTLNEGIGRFAPVKKLRDNSKSPKGNAKASDVSTKCPDASNLLHNHENQFVSSANKVAKSAESRRSTNGRDDNKGIADKVNNKTAVGAGNFECSASDAGTYTIDNEEEEENVRRDGSCSNLDGLNGVNDEKFSTKEWVNMWAANNSVVTNVKTECEYEDDFEDDEEESSLSSVREGTGESRSRRRLPATPRAARKNPSRVAADCKQVDDYLGDTISLMASMEARINDGAQMEDSKRPSTARHHKTLPQQSPFRSAAAKPSAKTSGGKTVPPAGSAASIEAANKAKELEAWKRRKNYDPLRAAAGVKKAQASNLRALRSHDADDSYSEDACSDLDVSLVRQLRETTKFPRGTGSNRTSTLRQTNCSAAQNGALSSKKRQPSQDSFSRNSGGRWSLRDQKNNGPSTSPAMTSSVHSAQSLKKSPAARNAVAAAAGGRSTSSLSSKEAEFQAWKRRKNYDPLRSKRPSTAKVASSPQQSTAGPIRRGDILPARESRVVTSNRHKVPISSPFSQLTSQDNLLRSASFHYPDGLSRVQLNVYTSEDDDEPQVGEFPSGLYEVNEDELILTIGGNGGPPATSSVRSMWPDDCSPRAAITSPNHRRGRNPRVSPSRSSGSSKLEALDNLVISTIFSISTKLCQTSGQVIKQLRERVTDKEHGEYLNTLLYVLEDVDPPMSPSKKTSRELAGTLRNLKKVEQALQTLIATSDEEQPDYTHDVRN